MVLIIWRGVYSFGDFVLRSSGLFDVLHNQATVPLSVTLIQVNTVGEMKVSLRRFGFST